MFRAKIFSECCYFYSYEKYILIFDSDVCLVFCYSLIPHLIVAVEVVINFCQLFKIFLLFSLITQSDWTTLC